MEENKKDSLNIHLTIHRKVVIGKELEFLLDASKQEAKKIVDEKQFVSVEKKPYVWRTNSIEEHNKGSGRKIIFILAGLIFLVTLIVLIADSDHQGSQKKEVAKNNLETNKLFMLLKSYDTITEAKFLNMSDRERQKGYKELKFYICDYKYDEIDASSIILRDHYTYDDEGNIVIKISRIGREESFIKSIYTYNQKYMLIRKITYYSHDSKRIMLLDTIKYHKGDTIIAEQIEKWFHVDGKIESINELKYDNKGNVISQWNHYADGHYEHKERIKNIYNNKNQLIKLIAKRETKELEDGKWNTESDIIVETPKYNKWGKQIEKGDMYNEKGQLIERISILDNLVKIRYNKRGLILTETVYKNGKPIKVHVYDYQ